MLPQKGTQAAYILFYKRQQVHRSSKIEIKVLRFESIKQLNNTAGGTAFDRLQPGNKHTGTSQFKETRSSFLQVSPARRASKPF